MSNAVAGQIVALYRYPVKGLTPEALPEVALSTGQTVPFDRAYAIENGPGPFDPAQPRYVPKQHFVMLMRNEQIAGLKAKFRDADHALTLWRDGAVQAQGDLRTEAGRHAIETVIAATVGANLRGKPRVVASPGHSFSDVAAKCLHIVNLESLRDLERRIGSRLNPLRFRPNIILDGWPAWSELDLVGHDLRAGPARLEIFKRTERCAATNVDPDTANRDQKIPTFLSKTFGHTDFGVYARVVEGGTVKQGDRIASNT